jgi:hypothetical protein
VTLTALLLCYSEQLVSSRRPPHAVKFVAVDKNSFAVTFGYAIREEISYKAEKRLLGKTVSFKEDGVSIAPNDGGGPSPRGRDRRRRLFRSARATTLIARPLKAKYTPMGFTGVPPFAA